MIITLARTKELINCNIHSKNVTEFEYANIIDMFATDYLCFCFLKENKTIDNFTARRRAYSLNETVFGRDMQIIGSHMNGEFGDMLTSNRFYVAVPIAMNGKLL